MKKSKILKIKIRKRKKRKTNKNFKKKKKKSKILNCVYSRYHFYKKGERAYYLVNAFLKSLKGDAKNW